MKRLGYLLLLILIVFSGCGKSKKKTNNQMPYIPGTQNQMYSSTLPNSGGNAGEIEIVIPKKIWDRAVGDSIFNYLTQPFPALPQDEPFFSVLQIDPYAFQSLYLQHRNILIINIGKQYKPLWRIEKNKWAYNQLVITLQAPDTSAFYKVFDRVKPWLLDTLHKYTIRRFQASYYDFLNDEAIGTLEKKFHIFLLIPGPYKIDVLKKNFAWISLETMKTSQEILVYVTPYHSKSDFSLKNILRRRDSVTRLNVPGPVEGSYAEVEYLYPANYKVVNQYGHYAVLVRGLWKTHGAFLGGPFVSLSVLDQKRHRIVTVDGFVYAGKLDKKMYLWEVESIVRSLRILD